MKSKKSHNRQARTDPSGIPPEAQRVSSSVSCFIDIDAKNLCTKAQEGRAGSVDLRFAGRSRFDGLRLCMQSVTELHGLRNQAQPRGTPHQGRSHVVQTDVPLVFASSAKGMGEATDLEVAFENQYPLCFM